MKHADTLLLYRAQFSTLVTREKASSCPGNEQLSWSHKLVLPCFREFERRRHHIQLWVRVVSRQDLHGGI